MADPYTSSSPVTPGTNVSTGAGYRIGCSAAGWVRLVMADGSPYDVYCQIGQGGEDGVCIKGVAVTNPNTPAASCIVSVMR